MMEPSKVASKTKNIRQRNQKKTSAPDMDQQLDKPRTSNDGAKRVVRPGLQTTAKAASSIVMET